MQNFYQIIKLKNGRGEQSNDDFITAATRGGIEKRCSGRGLIIEFLRRGLRPIGASSKFFLLSDALPFAVDVAWRE